MMPEAQGFQEEPEDEDEDAGEGTYVLAGLLKPEDCYRLGAATAPGWLLDCMNRDQIILRQGGSAEVFIRGRYITAHYGDVIARIGTTLTILAAESIH